jgi:hypothetical protein
MKTVYKARETRHWLRLLQDTEFLEKSEAISILADREELLQLSGGMVKTIKSRP